MPDPTPLLSERSSRLTQADYERMEIEQRDRGLDYPPTQSEQRSSNLQLTANRHHDVREALLGSHIAGLRHIIVSAAPDELHLELNSGAVVVIRGKPLDLCFEEDCRL